MHILDCRYCGRQHPPLEFFDGHTTPIATRRGYKETREVSCDRCGTNFWRFFKNIEQWLCPGCKRDDRLVAQRLRYRMKHNLPLHAPPMRKPRKAPKDADPNESYKSDNKSL
jgi:hypothetical protein